MADEQRARPATSGRLAEDQPLNDLEKRLGYRFVNRAWLAQALIHSSFAHEFPQVGASNERLEFLGDAVLNLVISDALVTAYPEASEGDLSRLRASLVNARHLATLATRLALGACLRLGRGEEQQAGHQKPSVLADALEALIGAVYLDGGYAAARAVVLALFAASLAALGHEVVTQDYKTALQEYVQKLFKMSPEYRLVQESGPAHARRFVVEVWVAGTPLGQGEGNSKKQASQRAAHQALLQLQKELGQQDMDRKSAS
ncbi:MAG: ribonuclease III [Desulfobacca sp.]|uniref:ribonuclease III n=1 Tax=Desulfobacca sp. TaxID=2067990 RepID=UPI00404B0178